MQLFNLKLGTAVEIELTSTSLYARLGRREVFFSRRLSSFN